MNRHLHTLSTPQGRVMYTHHEVESLCDGIDRFLSDGYLVPADGSVAVSLSIDELLGIIAHFGTGETVSVAGSMTASSELTSDSLHLATQRSPSAQSAFSPGTR